MIVNHQKFGNSDGHTKTRHKPCQRLDLPVEIRATPDSIVSEVFIGLLGSKIFAGVGPQEVAHWPERGRFLQRYEKEIFSSMKYLA